MLQDTIITVAFAREKPTAKGTPMLSVKDTSEVWYNCFDVALFEALAVGSTLRISFEEKKGFKNIQAIHPTSAPVPLDQVNDILASPSNPPALAPMPKRLEPELAGLLDERKAALEAASLVFAHGRIPAGEVLDYANWALGYLHGKSAPWVGADVQGYIKS